MTDPVEPAREETIAKLVQEDGLTTASLAGVKPQGDVRPAEDRTFEAAAASLGIEGPSLDGKTAPLLSANETSELRGRWDAIQAGFVDEPRKAVEDADGLVAAAMKRLAEMFADERARLEGQWDRGDDVSTEDLRLALRRYRSFFDRLLAI